MIDDLDSNAKNIYFKNVFLESSIIIIASIASVLIPALKAELFPYSSFALFTDAPQFFVEYEISDSTKNRIMPSEVFLQRNYYGISPREPYARVKPFSYDKFGHLLEDSVVERAIHEGLASPNAKAYTYPIEVRQHVYRATENGVELTHTIVLEIQASGDRR